MILRRDLREKLKRRMAPGTQETVLPTKLVEEIYEFLSNTQKSSRVLLPCLSEKMYAKGATNDSLAAATGYCVRQIGIVRKGGTCNKEMAHDLMYALNNYEFPIHKRKYI